MYVGTCQNSHQTVVCTLNYITHTTCSTCVLGKFFGTFNSKVCKTSHFFLHPSTSCGVIVTTGMQLIYI